MEIGVTDIAPAIEIVRRRLREIARQEIAAEDRLTKLRQERKSLQTAMRALDPTFDPPSPNGKKKTTPKASAKAGEMRPETIDRVEAFLRTVDPAELPDEGFTATWLSRTYKGQVPSHELIVRVMPILHERELVRIVGRARGGGTLWKVVGT